VKHERIEIESFGQLVGSLERLLPLPEKVAKDRKVVLFVNAILTIDPETGLEGAVNTLRVEEPRA